MARGTHHRAWCCVAACMLAATAIAAPPGEDRPLGPPPKAVVNSGEASGEAPRTSWTTTALALGGVVVLILGAGAGLRALARRTNGGGLLAALGPGGRAPSGVLEVLARFPVGRGATLVLLKLDRRVLLVCQNASRSGGGAMNVLAEITDPEEVASILLRSRDAEGDSIARKFEGLLAGESAAYTPPAGQPLASRPRAEPSVAATKVKSRLTAMRGRAGVEVRA